MIINDSEKVIQLNSANALLLSIYKCKRSSFPRGNSIYISLVAMAQVYVISFNFHKVNFVK